MASCSRRTVLIVLSPVLLVVAILAVGVGMAFVGGYDPTAAVTSAVDAESVAVEQLAVLSARCVLIPFQIIFIGIVLAGLVSLVRRSQDISRRVLDPLVAPDQSVEAQPDGPAGAVDAYTDPMLRLRPQRQVTLTQIGGSLLGAVGLGTAFILILGQFVDLTDLAIIVTALTSAVAWGARLPVSDLLGGISNLMENNFNIGDRIAYRHFRLDIEGIVTGVNLRFTSLRSHSGEAVTIPFGEIRTFRNFSRSTFTGVYVTFPVPSDSLQKVVGDFEALAAESMTLVPALIEPWRVISQDGVLAPVVEISLYGRGPAGEEEALQVALHTAVWQQLQTYDLDLEADS